MMLVINDLDITFLLQCLIGWLSLYYLLFKLFPTSQYSEWNCRIVTVIHAVGISVMAGYSSFIEGPWPLTDAGGRNTPLQITTATICLAYFIFDFSWCLKYGTEGLTMLLHHVMSITGLTVSLMTGQYGTELVATICGGELTNPLLQLRWFLRQTGYKDSKFALIVDAMFVFSFGFMRLVIGSILLYCYFKQPTDYLGRFGALCIYAMGVIFWINIIQYAIWKFSSRTKCDKNNSNESHKLSNGSTIKEKPHLNGITPTDLHYRANGITNHIS